MLPLGFGWSLWVHLFAQYPKSVCAVLMALVLVSVPADAMGLSSTDHSVAWELLARMLNS